MKPLTSHKLMRPEGRVIAPVTRLDHFYHGTSATLSDTVLPPSKSGAVRPNMSSGRQAQYDSHTHASVSEREATAWQFAQMSAFHPATGGRSAVYTTGRAPDQRLGVEHKRNDHFIGGMDAQEHISAKGFPITGRIDIRPPSPSSEPHGLQGTLPTDWSKIKQHDLDLNLKPMHKGFDIYDLDGNHPSMHTQNTSHERVREQDSAREIDEQVAVKRSRGKGLKGEQATLF